MAMQVSGYYPNQLGGAASPMTMPVMTQPTMQAQSTDAYIQSAAVNAPAVGGLFPGKTATNAVRDAKGFFQSAKTRPTTARGMRAKAVAAQSGRSAMLSTVTGAIKSSLIVNGLLSLAINGWKISQKQETMADGGANFAGDMTSAVVGGAAAGLLSGAGTFLLAGLLGTGLPLTLAGMALGCIGYFVADNALRGTQFYNQIKASVHNALSK